MNTLIDNTLVNEAGTAGNVITVVLVVVAVLCIIGIVKRIIRGAKRAAMMYLVGAGVAGGGITNFQSIPENIINWISNAGIS